MPIDNASFTLTPINPNTYRLTVDFYEKGNKVSSSNPLVFTQAREPEGGMIFDGATFNRTGKSKPKDVLKHVIGRNLKEDTEAIQSAGAIIPSIRAILERQSLGIPSEIKGAIVADIKDSNNSYANIDQIRMCQSIVEEYFVRSGDKFPEIRDAVQELFHKFNINKSQFIIGEGPLKHSLLSLCGPEQQQFLLTSKKPQHCLFAEFLMNGFKFGHIAQEEGNSAKSYSAHEYIHYIGPGDAEQFTPVTTSVVILPPEYKEVYPTSHIAPDFEALSPEADPLIFSPKVVSSSVTDTGAASAAAADSSTPIDTGAASASTSFPPEGGLFVDAMRKGDAIGRGKLFSQLVIDYHVRRQLTSLIIQR